MFSVNFVGHQTLQIIDKDRYELFPSKGVAICRGEGSGEFLEGILRAGGFPSSYKICNKKDKRRGDEG